MNLKTLHARWGWTTGAAIATFAVLAVIDLKLKSETGFGTVDLQTVWTADGVSRIAGAWFARRHALMAGFNLGFDYLFMPLYGFAFFYGTVAARERFTPRAGTARRLMTIIAAVPLAGALFDMAENALETAMIVGQPTDRLAAIAYTATTAKLVCFYVGAFMSLVGVIGLFVRARKKAEAEV